MGQSSSSARDREEFSRRDSRPFSQLTPEQDLWASEQHDRERARIAGTEGIHPLATAARSTISRRLGSRSTQPFATFRRQVSAQSIPVRGEMGEPGRSSSTQDEVLYEQEERPLVNMEDLRMRDARITHITASPMPRRPSVISRLGSRLLPRYTVTGSAPTEESGNREGRTLRRRLSDNPPPHTGETSDSHSHRFSMLGSLASGSSSSSRASQRRDFATISRPIPLLEDGSVPPSGLPTTPLRTSPDAFTPSSHRHSVSGTAQNSVRSSRLARWRRSMPSFESLFTSDSTTASNDRPVQQPPRRPTRTAMADETDYLLPPLNVTDTNLDLEDSAVHNSENLDRRQQETFPNVAESPERSPTWAQRWTERTPSVRREARRVPSLLRGRSSRLIRRDDEVPLSRILQIAAAAIAAQLSGGADGMADMEALSDDGLDGSLTNFFETMHNAAGTNTLNDENHERLATLPPLNFLRVFRFVNSRAQSRQASSRSSRQGSTRTQGGGNDDSENRNDGSTDGRMVTLVVVGVRSVPSTSINRDDEQANIDALLNLPIPAALPPVRTGSTGGLLRHANGRSRFSHRRRASMGGVNPFPANYDSQRHQRMHSASRPVSGDSTPLNVTAIPAILSESPPGPHPPPTTPAETILSAHTSRATTPSRRPSSASALQLPLGGYEDHDTDRLDERHNAQAHASDPAQTVRQRRRSDSEFARHRDLGAGAARRNGVVEPDDAPSPGRTWLIYVVGTNLSEDHPAFTTPSLFTDNPTYEDMLLLSSLLGPAKPPVASREDVASASGIYTVRLRRLNGVLDAVTLDESSQIHIAPGERCLVCLSDYEQAEEIRQLDKCKHVFHRECIDVWLTTGRNSCPLCRGQGVDEKAPSRPSPIPGEVL